MPMSRKVVAALAGKASWTKSGFTPSRKAALKRARQIMRASEKPRMFQIVPKKTVTTKGGGKVKAYWSESLGQYVTIPK